ncbi:unnamed protein product [Rotaria magnacalcarata]|uniref:Uncharacterized protein n=1 Tax=Rotaria magnacalcarata TaxID=392030 RepID=A0A816ZTG6_9BILA|nr:unnamed protein product [Rotaria magnacalcarata]CAF2232651.1 unnamed protein product [Rotaria magnacalcarata]CAF4016170.1 unnamed protein product [Rotaria magnacalcarata]CAF5112399.1 unnamed protein product [Rotaria magnacalcarata]
MTSSSQSSSSTTTTIYAMSDIIFVIIVITAGTGLFIGSIVTTYFCYKLYLRNQLTSSSHLSKQQQQQHQRQQQQEQQQQDYLHSVIINQHIARQLRPNSAISFISDNYHNTMTLIASPHRLAMLEQQQKQEPTTLVIENPLISLSPTTDEQRPTRLQSFVYENPTLELGELPTI